MDTLSSDVIKQVRKLLGLNQVEFWANIGITQSSGSRYESDTPMPDATRQLFTLVYIDQINLLKVNRIDMEIALLLRIDYPELYRNLQQAYKLVYKKDFPSTLQVQNHKYTKSHCLVTTDNDKKPVL